MTRISQRRLSNLGVAGLAGLLAVAVAGPADARGKREEAAAEFAAARPAGLPLMAVVSLGDQRITVYDADGKILQAPVSTGRSGYETPAGIYSVIQKERGALLQPLFRCGHAVHAAHHLVGHRAPCRRAARLSRLARLHPHAGGLRRAAVRHDQARSQGGGGARRHAPRRVLPSGALQARPDPLASRGRRAHSGHVGGRSADATHAARCTAACGDRGAADLAGGRRRSARGGREGEPRRPRRRAGPRSRPTPISHAP